MDKVVVDGREIRFTMRMARPGILWTIAKDRQAMCLNGQKDHLAQCQDGLDRELCLFFQGNLLAVKRAGTQEVCPAENVQGNIQ
jgi:hypothetical protein